MKPTLYEALGLSRTAAQSEIKAALRRLVRRYYAKTRAGDADVEEALRFLNHASHVLGNPGRRAEYDVNLAENSQVEDSLTTPGGSQKSDAAHVSKSETGRSQAVSEHAVQREKPSSSVELARGWSAQLAEFRRTRAGQLTGLLIGAFVFLMAWQYALPSISGAGTLKFGLLLLAVVLGTASVVFAVVHLLCRSAWPLPAVENVNSLVEGMIPRWRRDRTVFIGADVPVEDATWLFRLRMAELKRVSAERVSDPQPAMRLLARMFDYALWGMTVIGVPSLLVWLGVAPAALDETLGHPLLAPIWITATWIPVEALLLTQVQTTPGRWLLCVYLHYAVSNSYSPEELRFTFGAAIRRAAAVWWRGCAGWLPVVSLVVMARAREHVKRAGETTWDSERDCLVTHGPVGYLSLFTVALGLAACAMVFSVRWQDSAYAMSKQWRAGWGALAGRIESLRAPALVPMPQVPKSPVSRIDDVQGSSATSTVSPAPAPAPAPAPVPAPAPTIVPAKPAAGPAEAPAPAPRAQSPEPSTSPTQPPRSTATDIAKKKNLAAAPVTATPAPALSPIELRDRRNAAYSRQAQRQRSAGDFAGLARTCQRWADDDWRNPQAFYCAGLGLQGIGQHKQAIAMFNKAGALLPTDDPLKTAIDDAVLRSFRAETGG